ncbi:hypothetical protein phD2B_0014 [Lelliottia phage phD2B]|uniref:Uncharacterized protein n=1 Tax=Lelliottia phage phD2B TaxID=1542498 RepID=A0A088FSA6_9CAUD|nr:hypothetical protein phD2B_0014 [Lelliottia phage phD2B]AIM51241.1 hypothetical protein phD2B_0014 [Lelliottia phage phD2B]
MHGNKHSLTMFDGHEDLQATVTNDAFLFAQVMMEEAKKNRIDRSTFIKEATEGRTCQSTGHRRRSR